MSTLTNASSKAMIALALAMSVGAGGARGGAAAQTTAAVAQPPTPQPPQMIFGSLVASRVEARAAPGLDQPVVLVFQRAGLPVQLLDGKAGWFNVRDADGAGGWVRADLVSRRRTAVVKAAPGSPPATQIAVRVSERPTSDAIALLEPGVLVGLVACDGEACRVSVSSVRGFIDQRQLWGVGPGEAFR